MSDDEVRSDADPALTIDCNTCVATGTTACSDCLVGHLLANEGGPIGLVVATREAETDRVLGLFGRAGLIDDPPVFVTRDEFAAAGAPLRLVRSP